MVEGCVCSLGGGRNEKSRILIRSPSTLNAMLVRVFSFSVIGLEGGIVDVEVDIGGGLPGVTILGPKSLNFPILAGR